MKIKLNKIGKRFNEREWVFRNLEYTFDYNQTYAITGSNGSGKSTLTQIISGIMPATTGSIEYEYNSAPVHSDDIFQHISYAAPYLELIEEFTLKELLNFHFKFKKLCYYSSKEDLIEAMYLQDSHGKYVGNFSSGMKQRLKLGLALFSESEITILDEPTSNMDERGVEWYHGNIGKVLGKRMTIIASNQPQEYKFTNNIFSLNTRGREP
ncbi:MAG: ATP-binding cassette domain-containing protein [Cyclobacteriaceae bacterium]